jgi:hypothetical protein
MPKPECGLDAAALVQETTPHVDITHIAGIPYKK